MAERPEDLNLPAAVVSRLMKDALPDGCNVSKEARQAVCRAASVFVLYLTSQSNSLAQQSKRKTVSGGDVIAALTDMDFDEFSDPLKEALQDHKNRQKNKKAIKKRRTDETVEAAAEEPTAAADTAAEQGDTAAEELTAAPGEPTAAGDAVAEEPTAAADTTD